eukprot:SAG11_NODE_10059_length_860_cov_1.239159_1_plen_97_part_00
MAADDVSFENPMSPTSPLDIEALKPNLLKKSGKPKNTLDEIQKEEHTNFELYETKPIDNTVGWLFRRMMQQNARIKDDRLVRVVHSSSYHGLLSAF